MKKGLFGNGLVFGIILLFVGLGIQPAFAEMPIDSDNSELVEINVEIYEVDKTYNHTVMLTRKQAEELDILINNIETELESADNSDEAKKIFKDKIVLLKELGLIPDSISLSEAQDLVIGEKQNPRVVNIFERYYNKNLKILNNDSSILCLLAGKTINTVFIGPITFLLGFNAALILARFLFFSGRIKDFNPNLYSPYYNLYRLRMVFWLALAGILNFLPLKIGAYIHYGWFQPGPFGGSIPVPAEGWINTYDSSGKKEWSGDFYGEVFGFTGIKIITGFLNFYYFGAALWVKID